MGRCRAAGAQCFALLLDELTAAVVGPLARGAAGTDDSAGATAVDAATSLPPALCAALSERFQASCIAAVSLTAGLSHSKPDDLMHIACQALQVAFATSVLTLAFAVPSATNICKLIHLLDRCLSVPTTACTLSLRQLLVEGFVGDVAGGAAQEMLECKLPAPASSTLQAPAPGSTQDATIATESAATAGARGVLQGSSLMFNLEGDAIVSTSNKSALRSANAQAGKQACTLG